MSLRCQADYTRRHRLIAQARTARPSGHASGYDVQLDSWWPKRQEPRHFRGRANRLASALRSTRARPIGRRSLALWTEAVA